MNRLRGMRIMAQRQADAVIAAACAEDEADACAAAEAALLPRQPDPRPTPEESAAVDGPPQPPAASTPGASRLWCWVTGIHPVATPACSSVGQPGLCSRSRMDSPLVVVCSLYSRATSERVPTLGNKYAL